MINEVKIATTEAVTFLEEPTMQGVALRGDDPQTVEYAITAGASASGNIQVRLNGVDFFVAVTAGDSVATVFTKLYSAVYSGWSQASSFTPTVRWKYNTPGELAGDFLIDPLATGVTGTTTVTAGYTADLVGVFGMGAANGIYKAGTPGWERHPDHDTSEEFVRPWEIFVREGTYANWRFQFTNIEPPILGTSVLNFEPIQRESVLIEGEGLTIDPVNNTIGIPRRIPGGVYSLGPLSLTVTRQGFVDAIFAGYGRRVYIEGFIPSWSAGLPGISAGAAWLDGTYTVLEISLDSICDAGVRTANELMYFYLQPTTTSPQVIGDGTPPAEPFLGTARAMSGIPTSRYLFAAKNNAAATGFYNFHASALSDNRLKILYLEDTTSSPFRVLTGGSATTNQTVDLGPNGLKLVPPTCRLAYLHVLVNATSGAQLSNSEASVTASLGGIRKVIAAERGDSVWMPLDAAQQFTWANSTTGGSTSIDVLGYIDRR